MKTKINTFIRDVTCAEIMSESEVRRRLIEILEEVRERVRIVEVVQMNRDGIRIVKTIPEIEHKWDTLMDELRDI